MAIKVGMVSLGCSKNQVDAEILLALMLENGYEICADPQQCDVVIINTCGFIEDAKKESIETIFEFAQLKNEGQVKVLVVTGCLAERYQDQLVSEIPEADVVLGIGKNTEIAKAVKEALDKKELSINKGYDLTRQLQNLPEEQREQAAAEALEYEKAKKELKKQDAEIDRKGKIAALFCKAYEKAVLLTPSEENVRCWTDGTRMTPEEMRDTVKESRDLAEVFRTIADIIEQKILPADWRCADAESEENDAQPDGNPA